MIPADPLSRARELINTGALAEAWHPVRCALAMEPASSSGLTVAGQIAIRQNAAASAVRYFTRAAQAGIGRDHRVLLNLARAQQAVGRTGPAIATARLATRLAPADPDARRLLFLLLIEADRSAEADGILRDGDENGLNPAVAMRIARRLSTDNRFVKLAARMLNRAMREPGDHIPDAIGGLLTAPTTPDPQRLAMARKALLLSPATMVAMDVVALGHARDGTKVRQASWLWRSSMVRPDDLPRLARAAERTYEVRWPRAGIAANRALLKVRPGAFSLVDRICQLHILQKDPEQALAFGRDQLDRKPADPRIWDAVAGMYKSVGCLDEALALWPEIIRRFPQYYTLYYNFSLFLDEQNRLAEATVLGKAALILKPDYLIAANHLSVVMHRQERTDIAMQYIERALKINDRHANAHMNKGNYLRATGHYGRAVASFRRAEEAAAGDPASVASCRFNAGMSKIAVGELEDGFRLIEARWATKEFPSPKRAFRQAIWPGPHAAPASDLLLYMEQGLGDEFMMSWYIPLIRRDVRRLVVDCNERLVDLFSRSYEGVEFIRASTESYSIAQKSGLQYKIPSFHVPQFYVAEMKKLIRDNWDWAERGGTRFPARLTIAPDRLDRWRRWLDERFPDRPRIAVSWRSRLRNRDRDRQYLTVEQIASVIPSGSVVINLQYSSTEEELDEFREIGHRRDFLVATPDGVDLTDDLEDILAILQEADAAVTPLISLAWMAGTVGCPTYVFRTSAERLLWHQMGTPFVPWAPCLKLFFRHSAESWGPTIADVRHALSDYLRSPLRA
ncbi:MAG: hypothetical protein RLO51_04015 [Thalassobaculum sp.]|uniref:tetratricopeptide repeat protein n=1 Tax=Thalassobaculum sp. TaxID=2022740 RepID=UPI0032EBDEC8